MARKIEFEMDGTEYTLEYSRRAQTQMESNGFVLEAIGDKPQLMIPMLFRGAFIMHHPRIKEEVVKTIYNRMTNKEELLRELMECYSSVTDTLFDEPEDDSKKVTWRKAQ